MISGLFIKNRIHTYAHGHYNEVELFHVEKVIDIKPRRKNQFLVKWEGYGDDFNSWISASDLLRFQRTHVRFLE